jgi:hypothetical protein
MAELDDRTAPSLMGDLVTHVTELVRKEIQLFRAEMNDKATQILIALGSIVAGVVIVLTALNVLAAALVAALTNAGLPAAWAAVLVGGLLAIAGIVLANRGIANLKAQKLAPTHTARSASRDASMIKEKI